MLEMLASYCKSLFGNYAGKIPRNRWPNTKGFFNLALVIENINKVVDIDLPRIVSRGAVEFLRKRLQATTEHYQSPL